MPGPRRRDTHAMRVVALSLLLVSMPPMAHVVPSAQDRGGRPAFDFHDAALDPGSVLEALLESLSDASMLDRLELVNGFFNRLHQGDDRDIWGVEDHWAAPSELLSRGAGDCEDLAIAKYFTLRRLGVPAAALRVTYVRDLRQARSHMTLLYLPAGRPALVLDNEADRPAPLSLRPELVPVYGVNEERVTVHVPGGSERSFPHAGRWMIHRWQDMVVRARMAGVRSPAAAGPRAASAGMFRPRPHVRDLPGAY